MSARDALLQRLRQQHVLRSLDAELGTLMLRLDPEADPLLGLAVAAASLALSQGHSCLPLTELDNVLAETAPAAVTLPPRTDLDGLRRVLRASVVVGSATHADAHRPLQLDAGDRLYLRRYFAYERAVARNLRRCLALRLPETNWPVPALRALLQRHFTLDGTPPDWQALAVLTGLVSPLTVITGGPGTGKTSTVLWLLVALLEQAVASGTAMPRIRLAAPTGKAAARLGESLRERGAVMDLDDRVREAMPAEAATLHRLLGVRAGSTRFRHHRDHPLDADVVVVDEASMVDLPLMAKLLDALPEHARLILLGDRDQLASVEAGNVLAGLCRAAGEDGFSVARARQVERVVGAVVPSSPAASPFADAVVALRASHRFGSGSALARLAGAIRDGDPAAVRATLADVDSPQVNWERPTDAAAHVVTRCIDAFAALGADADPAAALREAARLRVLTALRQGPSGCVAINAALEHRLRQRAGVAAQARWYPGRLLLITENDVDSGLFNGDIGIVLPDVEGRPVAWFPALDGGVRSLPPSALPAHESAFAMTIHKSQGSEFDRVVIVLPHDDARVLGRELLYTAVTRARKRVELVAGERALQCALARSTHRFSGLAERLSGGD